MRYKDTQKEETRRRMLDAASRSFRSWGFSGIGVDGLAKAAGVTSGAFYTHFGSKRAAFGAALEVGLNEVIAEIPRLQQEHGKNWVKAFAEYYLSESHREDMECGCAMASLTTEVVRSDEEAHAAYEEKMTQIADLKAQGLAGQSKKKRRAKAWAVLSILIGGLNIARAVKSSVSAEEIARSVRAAAVIAAGETG
ncbi:TetR/AcrR family transcriptional regulator [Kaarinaea lacus]